MVSGIGFPVPGFNFSVPGHEMRQAAAVGDGEVGAALGGTVALRVVFVKCERSFRLFK
jgi:hypothetical protein